MTIKALVMDFSRVLIFANTDVPTESLGSRHATLAVTPGYRVLEHFTLNAELLAFLRVLSSRAPIYLLTSGHLHALPDITPSLAGIFAGIFTTEEIGYPKSRPEAFIELALRTGLTPPDLLVIDDQPGNIAAARQAGCVAYQYTDNQSLITALTQNGPA